MVKKRVGIIFCKMFVALMLLVCIEISSMELVTPPAEEVRLQQIADEIANKLENGKIYVYDSSVDSTGDGVVVDQEVWELCLTLKNPVDALTAGIGKVGIPFPDTSCSIDDIKNCFDFLKNYVEREKKGQLKNLEQERINKLTVERLVTYAAMIERLQISDQKVNQISKRTVIKKLFKSDSFEGDLGIVHAMLPDDFLLNMLQDEAINHARGYLKKIIINLYHKERSEVFDRNSVYSAIAVSKGSDNEWGMSVYGEARAALFYRINLQMLFAGYFFHTYFALDSVEDLLHSLQQISSIGFSENGTRCIVGGFSPGNVKSPNNAVILGLLSLVGNKQVIGKALPGCTAKVLSVALSPDGTKAAVGFQSEYENLKVWDISDFTNPDLIYDGKGCVSGRVSDVVFTTNTDIIFLYHEPPIDVPKDKLQCKPIVYTKNLKNNAEENNKEGPKIFFDGTGIPCDRMAVSSDGKKIALSTLTGTVVVVDSRDKEQRNNKNYVEEKEFGISIDQLIFSPEDDLIVMACRGKVEIWNQLINDDVITKDGLHVNIGMLFVPVVEPEILTIVGQGKLRWTLFEDDESRVLQSLKTEKELRAAMEKEGISKTDAAEKAKKETIDFDKAVMIGRLCCKQPGQVMTNFEFSLFKKLHVDVQNLCTKLGQVTLSWPEWYAQQKAWLWENKVKVGLAAAGLSVAALYAAYRWYRYMNMKKP